MKLTSITAARDAARPSGWFVAAAWVVFSAGCVSNPTPHPSGEVTDTVRGDDMTDNTPQDEDGCVAVGGFWDGTACFGAGDGDVDTVGPENEVDTTDGDGVDTMDSVDGTETRGDGDPGPGDDTEP